MGIAHHGEVTEALRLRLEPCSPSTTTRHAKCATQRRPATVWQGSRKQMIKNTWGWGWGRGDRDREQGSEWEMEKYNLITWAQYPPTPLSLPQFFLELRVIDLSWLFCGQKKVAWRTSRCYRTSLFRLGKRRPIVARPPKAKEEHRNQNLGVGARSSACKTKTEDDKCAISPVKFSWTFMWVMQPFYFPLTIESPLGFSVVLELTCWG